MTQPSLRKSVLTLLLLAVPSLGAAELSISGVDKPLKRNIRAFAALGTEPCDAEAWRIRRRYRSLEREARQALEPFGYYNARTTSTLNLDGKCWNATLDIDPGEPVIYRNIDIDIVGPASADPAFRELSPPASLVAGGILLHADYDRYKRALQVLAADRGYVEAEFAQSSIEVWPEENIADVTIHFLSGPRYRFGDVNQTQNFLEPALVTSYLDLQSGAPFDGRELARAYTDLSSSRYFSRVEVVADIDNARDGEIPIQVVLQPADRIEYTVGLGASTDTGVRFRAGLRNNRVNKRGHKLITDLAISPIIQGINTEYRKPLDDPRSEWTSYTAAVSREDNDTFVDETFRFSVRRSKRIKPYWIRTLSLGYDFERFTLGTEADDSSLLLPAIAFDHRHTDKPIYPNRGRRFGVELRGASENFGSNTSFVQIRAWARWIRAVGENSRLLARAKTGFTQKSDFDKLPPSVRFFAGGDQSVRGFDYDSLGPQDEDGNVIGGSNLLEASLEYERRLWGNFYGAVFLDAGNAFDGFNVDAAVGTGLGVKWRSPLGPIRVYLGYPLTGDEQSIRLHIGLGAEL